LFDPSARSCPAFGVLDALIPPTEPAFVANGGTLSIACLAAWPTDVVPIKATMRATTDRVIGTRCFIGTASLRDGEFLVSAT
jgi:hypothetical protein